MPSMSNGQEAAASEEIAELRQMITALEEDYQRRMAELERRIERAEQAAADAAAAPATAAQRTAPTAATPEGGSVTAGNAFNPQISVILDGAYYRDDIGGDGSAVLSEAAQPSHVAHGEEEHAHGTATSNGFRLHGTELAFSAAVDPYFDASAYLAFESGGEVHVEEAWLATRGLPSGLQLKGGRFLSDFGYLNNRHRHLWDFADQNLPYRGLLGDHGLQDTGLQLTWLPALPLYTRLGVELLQGDQERFAALVEDADRRADFGLEDARSGPRLVTLFAELAPDLGYDHALQIGASYVRGRQHQEIHDEEAPATGLAGDAELWGLDVVYRHDDPAAYGYGDLSVQAEYLRSIKKLTVSGGDGALLGSARELTTDGLYVQGIYGFAPRWQAGLRYDVVGLTNDVDGSVQESLDSSDRWTGAVTWTPTEFSRFRAQYSHSNILTETGSEAFDAFWLQFLISLGAHGAHSF